MELAHLCQELLLTKSPGLSFTVLRAERDTKSLVLEPQD